MFSFKFAALVVTALIQAGVQAETHTITFVNNCGIGTPTLKQNGNTLSTGGPYTSNGPLEEAIAYLDDGSCGPNGEGCTVIEISLVNPTSPGSGSITDISLVPPRAFSVPSGFEYYDGCDGTGADCTSATCTPAVINPGHTGLPVACQADNGNLKITFCD